MAHSGTSAHRAHVLIVGSPQQMKSTTMFYCVEKELGSCQLYIRHADFDSSSLLPDKFYKFQADVSKNEIHDIERTLNPKRPVEIARAAKFQVDHLILQRLRHAEDVSLPEAAISPKKRRISIPRAVVKNLATSASDDWQRTDITINDGPTTLDVKLWKDDINKIPPTLAVGSTVAITNLVVDEYRSRKFASATSLSSIDVIPNQRESVISIDAMTPVSTNPSLVKCFVADEEYLVRRDIIHGDLETLYDELPIDMRVKLDGNVILEIVEIIKDEQEQEQNKKDQ